MLIMCVSRLAYRVGSMLAWVHMAVSNSMNK